MKGCVSRHILWAHTRKNDSGSTQRYPESLWKSWRAMCIRKEKTERKGAMSTVSPRAHEKTRWFTFTLKETTTVASTGHEAKIICAITLHCNNCTQLMNAFQTLPMCSATSEFGELFKRFVKSASAITWQDWVSSKSFLATKFKVFWLSKGSWYILIVLNSKRLNCNA